MNIATTTIEVKAQLRSREEDPLRVELKEYEKRFREIRNAVETRLYSLSHHPNVNRFPPANTALASSSSFVEVNLSDDEDDDDTEDLRVGLQVEEERRFLTQLLEQFFVSAEEEPTSDEDYVVQQFFIHLHSPLILLILHQEINVLPPSEVEAPVTQSAILTPGDRVRMIEAEFLSTEEAYVKHLDTLITVLIPLTNSLSRSLSVL